MLCAFFLLCSALDSGTLTENGIIDGTEVRLVPAIESGVTVSLCRWLQYIAVMQWDVSVSVGGREGGQLL